MTMNDLTTRLIDALGADDDSTRLRAALTAGTSGDVRLVEALVERCGIDPDFFVRDMLTWALCRFPAEVTVPRLVAELGSANPQARSQALHTLSKIGDRQAFSALSVLLHDSDDDVARAAWRAAVALVEPDGQADLAADLARELGRGDEEVQLSLTRGLMALGESAQAVIDAHMEDPDDGVRVHATTTRRLLDDPDAGFDLVVDFARRVSVGVDG